MTRHQLAELEREGVPIGARRIALLALAETGEPDAIAAGVRAALGHDLLARDVFAIIETHGVEDVGLALEDWLDRHPGAHPLEARGLRLAVWAGTSERYLLRALRAGDAETRLLALDDLGEVGTLACLGPLRTLAAGSVVRSDVRRARAALDQLRERLGAGLSVAASDGALSVAAAGGTLSAADD